MTIGHDSEEEWFVSCRFHPGSDALEEVRPLNLTLASVSWLHMKDCSSRSYTQLLSQGLGITSLKEMRLEGKRRIVAFEQGSFTNMSQTYPSFIDLELKLAGITALSDNLLDDVFSLQHFTLDRTSIQTLPTGLLARLSDLRKLTIYWNRNLQAIPDRLLEQNNKLEYFQMASNPRITTLPDTLLFNLTRLEFLDTGSGSFQTIPPTLLQTSCKNLKTFTMLHDSCENSLSRKNWLQQHRFYYSRLRSNLSALPKGCTRHMPADLLSTCKSLKTFKYSRMYRETPVHFEDGFMNSPIRLTSLTIHSGLTSKEMSMIKHLKNLVQVNLSGNNLRKINDGEF